MRTLPVWFRSHPTLSILLAVAAIFTATHFFLNWKAERRWQAYVNEGRARGVKFDLTEFAPPKIPDEENFAALPMMRAIMQPGAKNPLALTKGQLPSVGSPEKGKRFDWREWQRYFKDEGFISATTDSAPRDVLLALERFDPQLQEWREWRTRPRCQFDLDLQAGYAMPVPHLGLLKKAPEIFALRMRAHLALGDSAAACEDFRDGFQAYRALAEEPTAASAFVKMAVLKTLISSAADALIDRSWSETDLRRIDAELGAVQIRKDYQLAEASERAFCNGFCDLIREAGFRKRVQLWFGGIKTKLTWESGLVASLPSRVFRDNQLRINQHFDELDAKVSSDGARFAPDRETPNSPENLRGLDTYYYFLHLAFRPLFERGMNQFISTQTLVDQFRIAMALERFRMARGAHPETLSQLVPNFMLELPRDTFSGEPMIYRRTEGDRFFLYSVGRDKNDDGGTKKTDAVWPY